LWFLSPAEGVDGSTGNPRPFFSKQETPSFPQCLITCFPMLVFSAKLNFSPPDPMALEIFPPPFPVGSGVLYGTKAGVPTPETTLFPLFLLTEFFTHFFCPNTTPSTFPGLGPPPPRPHLLTTRPWWSFFFFSWLGQRFRLSLLSFGFLFPHLLHYGGWKCLGCQEIQPPWPFRNLQTLALPHC